MSDIAEVIRVLRETYSRKKLAEMTGLTSAKIFNLEKGRTPRPEEVEAVERAYRDHVIEISTAGESAVTVARSEVPGVDTTGGWCAPSELVSEPAPGITWDELQVPEKPTGKLWLSSVVGELTPASSGALSASLEPAGENLELVQWVDAGSTLGEVLDATVSALKVMFEPLTEAFTQLAEVVVPNLSPTQMTTLDGVRRYANSEVQTFKQCRRRWWLTYYRGLRLRHEDPVGPKHIGDRVHRALERYYVPDGVERTDPRDALERLIVDDWTALTAHYARDEGQFEAPPQSVPPDLEKRFTRDADLERVMLDGYVQWVEETGADHEYAVVAAEEYRETDVAIVGVKIIAKLDARVLRKSDGARLILEHKTSGDPAGLIRGLHLDEQSQWQMLVERLQDDDDDDSHVAGALFNILKRVKRTARATPPFYQRVEVHRSPIETENFLERVEGVLTDIEQTRTWLDEGAAHRRVVYPTPTSDCRWRCPFFAVCGALDDGSRAEAMIENLYEKGDAYGYYSRD